MLFIKYIDLLYTDSFRSDGIVRWRITHGLLCKPDCCLIVLFIVFLFVCLFKSGAKFGRYNKMYVTACVQLHAVQTVITMKCR